MTTYPLSTCRFPASRRGSALIMVIWLIAMLTMVIYSMHRVVANDLTLTIAQKQGFRARELAEMGLHWAMNPVVKKYDRAILQQTGGGDSVGGVVLEEGESLYVRIQGEGGKMNINALMVNDPDRRKFMTNLFLLWGLDNTEADALFDRMIDWTDVNDEALTHGMEKKDYMNLYNTETSQYPFNHPFYSVEEMALVPGFDKVSANCKTWKDYFTVYSGQKLDVNEAEAKVLAAAALGCGDTPSNPQVTYDELLETAQQIVDARLGQSGEVDGQDSQKLGSASEALVQLRVPEDSPMASFFGVNDQTVLIRSVATVGDYRKRVELVVRNRTGTPQILSRREVPLNED